MIIVYEYVSKIFFDTCTFFPYNCILCCSYPNYCKFSTYNIFITLPRCWSLSHLFESIPQKIENFFFECLLACLCDEKIDYIEFSVVNQTYCQPSLQSRPMQHCHYTKLLLLHHLRLSKPSKTT